MTVNHKSKNILNAVKCQDSICRFPHALPVEVSGLKTTSDLVYVFGVCDCNLYVWVLLIALETVQVLSHNQSDGVYDRLMHGNRCLEVYLEAFTVVWSEGYWRRNV